MVTAFRTLPLIPRASAQVFNGGGIREGLDQAATIEGLANQDAWTIILNVLLAVLNFLALVAVVAIIAAGFFLVAGGGSDASKDRAKKIILGVVVGLVVILFARLIVAIILNFP